MAARHAGQQLEVPPWRSLSFLDLQAVERTGVAGLGSLRDDGHLAVSTAIELPPGKVLPGTAPLLEEERDFRRAALTQDVLHPFLAHRPRLRTGFAANDHPMNTIERQGLEG